MGSQYDIDLNDRDDIKELKARVKFVTDAAATINREVCQVLGKVLGFPWFKDDQKNFPGATEADGICEGDMVAEAMADLAAQTITDLKEKLRIAEAAAERRGRAMGLREASKIAADEKLTGVPPIDWGLREISLVEGAVIATTKSIAQSLLIAAALIDKLDSPTRGKGDEVSSP